MPDTSQNPETPSNAKTFAPDNAPSVTTRPTAEQKSMQGTQHRSKMSEEYDEALAQNTVPVGGGENQPLNQGENNVARSPVTPEQRSASPAENALSTQADDKMGAGEDLRDHDFPVPPQKSGAPSQRLVVDQEPMRSEGPRSGEAIGTLPGDRQNVGEAPNIMDQHAMTPDFPSQR